METDRRWGIAKQAGWGLNNRIYVVADGAEWIRQSREIGKQGHFLCDFFHVNEHLGAAAPVCAAHQPDRWRRTKQKGLRHGTTQKVVETLAERWNLRGAG